MSNQDSPHPMRPGRDSKKSPKASICNSLATPACPEKRLAFDAFGQVITDLRYIDVFLSREEFLNLYRFLVGLEARIRRLAETRGGAALHANELLLTRAKDELEWKIPHCVCLACHGVKAPQSTECGWCMGLGWMCRLWFEQFVARQQRRSTSGARPIADASDETHSGNWRNQDLF